MGLRTVKQSVLMAGFCKSAFFPYRIIALPHLCASRDAKKFFLKTCGKKFILLSFLTLDPRCSSAFGLVRKKAYPYSLWDYVFLFWELRCVEFSFRRWLVFLRGIYRIRGVSATSSQIIP